MLTKEDLKNIKELIQPEFDKIHLELSDLKERVSDLEETVTQLKIDVFERLGIIESQIKGIYLRLDMHENIIYNLYNVNGKDMDEIETRLVKAGEVLINRKKATRSE